MASLAERAAIGDRLRIRLEPAATALRGWAAVWVTVGLLVVLVVAGFLVGIVGALQSIDDSLADAAQAVEGVEGEADTLPGMLENVNSNLASVRNNTEPLDGQAQRIVASLESVRADLRGVEGSLNDTETSLDAVSGTLESTSAALDRIAALAGQIEGELVAAQSAESLGTNEIWRRVGRANGPLGAIEEDTGNILVGLDEVNKHLTSICKAIPPPFGEEGVPCE